MNKQISWRGVMPAITTPFTPDLRVDEAFFGKHCRWMADHRCTAIVVGGSLGEGATLTFAEKQRLVEIAIAESNLPVVLGVSALSTAEAVELARMAERAGCSGLMVLPPYVYRGDWRELEYHFDAVIEGTGLSCMLYNNPIAYGTDTLPDHVEALAKKHKNLHAIKESSADIRRLAGIRALIGDRLTLCVGVDDMIVEGIAAGAEGWVAGLVNAMPAESVALFERALARVDTLDLYSWFLPLLRLDIVVHFVQLIKMVQAEVGMGSEAVRPPRLTITGREREETLGVIRHALQTRPVISD